MTRIRTIEEFKNIHKPENHYFLIGLTEWDLIWIKNFEIGKPFKVYNNGVLLEDIIITYDYFILRNRRPAQIKYNAEWKSAPSHMRGIGVGHEDIACAAIYQNESEARSVYDQITSIETLIGRAYHRQDRLRQYVREIFDQ